MIRSAPFSGNSTTGISWSRIPDTDGDTFETRRQIHPELRRLQCSAAP
jgi:hypothetical protein